MTGHLPVMLTAAAFMICSHAIAQDPVVISPTSTDPGPISSEFGRALAATKKFLYVGAPRFDLGPTSADAGRVFIYNQKTLEFDTLFTGGLDSSAQGGSALAAGKAEVMLGAPGRIINMMAQGHASITYEKKDPIAYSNPAPAHGDRFGAAVAVSKKLVLIGAPSDVGGPGGDISGSAFVALRKDNVLVRLPMPSYNDGDRAGEAVAVSPKYIAVGAPGTPLSFPNAGAVHIYDAKDFSFLRTLSIPDDFTSPRFGSALVLSGNSLFVGAPTDSSGQIFFPDYIGNAGSVIEFDTRTWTQVHKYNSSDPQAGANFGRAIAVDKKNLVIGSPKFDDPMVAMLERGMVEVFDRKLRTWKSELESALPAANEEFGSALSILKRKRVAVGSPFPDHASVDGRVYVFTLP